jgi:general secretion pathway protein E
MDSLGALKRRGVAYMSDQREQNEYTNPSMEQERLDELKKREDSLLGQVHEFPMSSGRFKHEEDIDDFLSKKTVLQMNKNTNESSPQNPLGTQKDASGENSDKADADIRRIILKALDCQATDVHIDKINGHCTVRYRVEGKLLQDEEEVKVLHEELVQRLKVMAEFFTREKVKIQSGMVEYPINETQKIRFTVKVLPTAFGDLLLLRFGQSRKNSKIEDLGMTLEDARTLKSILNQKTGLVVVGGLSGSGRTTTLYAVINQLLKKNLDILLLENKVFDKMNGVAQVSLEDNKESSLVDLMTSISDFDMDVLVVDVELNKEVIKKLTQISLGGKLVVASAYFPSAYDAILGITSMGVEPYILAASLKGIICQQLARKLCPMCKQIKENENEKDGVCKACRGSGYLGSIAMFEIFKMSKDYWQLFLKKEDAEALKAFIQNERTSFSNNAKRLIDSGHSGVEEMLRLGIDPKYLK